MRPRQWIVAAMMLSLAWPLRGQFGHLHGATIPGVLAACAVALLQPDPRWRHAFGRSLLLGAAGFAVGGHLGYGRPLDALLHAPSVMAAWPAWLRLFLIGAVWGGIGMTALGIGLSERPLNGKALALLGGVLLAWLIPLGWLNWETWDLPLFALGLAAVHGYNAAVLRSRLVSQFGLAGVIGFGLGFLSAAWLLYAGHRGWLGPGWPWWQWRDQWIGACGGVAIAWSCRWAVRCRAVPHPSAGSALLQAAGICCLTVGVPLLNALDVLASWRSERPVLTPSALGWIESGLLVGALIMAWGLWRWALSTSPDRLVRWPIVTAIWLLSGLAIAKEAVPLGLSRWEVTYTLFLACAAILTGEVAGAHRRHRSPRAPA